ncbi:alpha-xenorhabdolysin family binary toxin subunit A [Pseudomonas sp. NPDC089395]|uniref:alpha-xenorhabdolysin family binary toxin subunit A n=1 Tax=Pseudomonas sp. NPDC089395 TaxID=3364460 RepID=UPI00381A8122
MVNGSVEDLPLFQGGDAQYQGGKPFDQLSEEQRAVLIPGQIFDLKKDEPAFIFSRENLKTIKRYEARVRQLPMPDEVSENASLSALGLEAKDVNVFFDNLRKHADSWDVVEDECKTMGADLQVFAENLIRDGGRFLSVIQGLETWESAPDGAAAAVPELSFNDKQTFSEGVDTYLQHIADEISEKLDGVRFVKRRIDRFGDDISENLMPMAISLLKHFNKQDVTGTLLSIESELVDLDDKIQKKLEEYNGLVGAAFYGLVFGPLGLVVTGGIFGAQAEDVRALKNKLIEQREQLSVKKNILLGGGAAQFEDVRTLIQDMQFRLVDVASATKNLEDVWVLLEAYAKSSLRKVKGINTQLELKRFVSGFERVVEPWKNILGITKTISELFNDALRAD